MTDGRRRLISISGASCSGMSTLAKGLVAALGDETVARVPADHYLRDADPATLSQVGHRWDWDRIAADLTGADGRRVRTPAYDFTALRRDPVSGSSMTFPLRRIMVIDAMAPIPGADLVVRVEVPPDERHRRLVERDTRWGTRVADRWQSLEASVPVVPPDGKALWLDGCRPTAELVDAIVAMIRSRGWLPD